MKQLVILFFLSYSWLGLRAQDGNLPLFVSYYGNNLIQPGLKIGTSFTLKTMDGPTDQKARSIVFDPQLAYFINPENSNNLLLNTNWGYRLQKWKKDKIRYQTFSIGLGYQVQSTQLGQSFDLASGEVIDTQRASEAYFYPTINYEFGRRKETGIGWFSRIGLGQLIANNDQSSLNVSVELGLQFQL